MLDKYMISVDGNNLLAYAKDDTVFGNFLVKLLSYYDGKKIEIKKVRHYDDPELHEFLHGYDLAGEDYALLTKNLQVFAQPCFEYFLNTFMTQDEDTEPPFIDYISYYQTSQFICAVQDIELSKEAD